MGKPFRIGQFSAFYGDRDDGIPQLLDSGVDVLVGDYLAELTMLVLRKNQLRGRPGYASTFLRQIEPSLTRIAEQGVKVLVNAGGLDPAGCAADLQQLVDGHGLSLTVASVAGDDLLHRTAELAVGGESFENIDTGERLDPDREILTANAYLGCWPMVEALRGGADIVVTGRVTDASLVMAPAAWHYGWEPTDLDPLAGALAAGHVIECGAQATGGQFSHFDEHGDLGLPGMPIVEMEADGSGVITKADGTGGCVTLGTVTAQLLYEIGPPIYENPDVAADFTTIRLDQVGPDRVRLSGATGVAPTDRLKVSLSYTGGYRNSAVVGITGGRVEAKVAWLTQEVAKVVGPPDSFDGFRVTVVGPSLSTDGSYDETTALVVFAARHVDPDRVGRRHFSSPITQLAVSNIPGYYLMSPPGTEQMFGTYWPTTVAKDAVQATVTFPGEEPCVQSWPAPGRRGPVAPATSPSTAVSYGGESVRMPLRDLIGTRSGDKGGNANLGVWARRPELYPWLCQALTVERIRELVPEAAHLPITRYELPNLLALNFVVHGWLEDGVASCLRLDAQAKGLGEYLGSRSVEVPAELLPMHPDATPGLGVLQHVE